MSLNLEAEVSLQPFNTFGVMTRARYLAHAHNDAEVGEALQAAKRLQLPLLVIGGGSNLLLTGGV